MIRAQDSSSPDQIRRNPNSILSRYNLTNTVYLSRHSRRPDSRDTGFRRSGLMIFRFANTRNILSTHPTTFCTRDSPSGNRNTKRLYKPNAQHRHYSVTVHRSASDSRTRNYRYARGNELANQNDPFTFRNLHNEITAKCSRLFRHPKKC